MTGIDLGIIAGYFVLTLAIGIWQSRGIRNIRDFSIGGYTYPSAAIVATMVVSLIGAENILGISEKVFDIGFIFVMAWLGNSLSLCLIARYVAPRMESFKGMISIGDIMHSFYGKPGRIITGCASLFLSIGYIGAQVASIGYLCDTVLGVPYFWGVLFGSGVVITYSTLGGIRAVTATDIMQFLVLIILVPILFDVGLNEVGGYSVLFQSSNLTQAKHITALQDSTTLWSCLALFLVVSIPFLDPVVTQRLLMAGSAQRIRKSLYITALIFVPFTLVAGFVGIVALSIDSTVDSSLVFSIVVNNVLPIGLRGLAITGMFAVIMSTADSYLNAASIAFVHDVIKPLSKKPISEKAELRIARLGNLLLGGMAIVVSVSFTSILDIIFKFLNFWGPVIVVPLFSGFFGLRASTRTFLVSVSAGMSSFILWTLFIGEYSGFDSLIPSMIVSALAFFSAHYLDRGRTVPLKLKAPIESKKPRPFSLALSLGRVAQYVPTFSNIYQFSQKRVALYGAQYSTFGIFAMVMYLVPFFMWSPQGYVDRSNLVLRVVASILAGGLIFNDFWSERSQKSLPIYWHFTLLYCLPFLTTYMLFKEGASLFWVMNMSLGVLFLAILVDWLSFVIILPLGVSLGGIFYIITHSMPSITLSPAGMFLLVYMCFFSTFIGLIFSRNKALRESLKKTHAFKIKNMAEQVSHDIRSPAVSLKMFCKHLRGLSEDNRDVIIGSTNRITDISNTLLSDNETEGQTQGELRVKPELLFAVIDSLVSEKRIAFENQGVELKTSIADYTLFASVDRVELQRVLCNLMNNAAEAFTESDEKRIVSIGLNFVGDTIRVYVEDNGCGIPSENLQVIFEEGKSFGKANGFGMGLAHAKRTLESWGGCISVESTIDQGTRVTLELKRVASPAWFSCSIDSQAQRIVIVDDVESIHQLWESRLETFKDKVELIHHYNPEDFLAWYQRHGKEKVTQYLIDYTFTEEDQNGLDLIEKSGLASNALLVTSFFEEKSIHSRCLALGVKLLPKYIVPYIPIVATPPSGVRLTIQEKPQAKKQVDLVMLDDAVYFTKSFKALHGDRLIDTYNTVRDFFAHYEEYAFDTKFCIDGDIHGTDGGDVAKTLHGKGYHNLHILTGLDTGEYQKLPWVKSVIEKGQEICF
tara:strand:- start:40354 stop:43800 length:3447 start_codon:yes stop_codon:yes gene_type:complete